MNTTISPLYRTFALLLVTVAFFGVIISCKKDSTDPAVLTSLQGTWKLTSLNVSPAYLGLTDIAAGLNALEGNCLGQATVTFSAAGAITNNVSSVTACSSAAKSKDLVNAFFSSATTYAETSNQVVLTTGPRVVTASKVLTATTATMVTTLDVDPGNNPVKTMYTVVLTKQ